LTSQEHGDGPSPLGSFFFSSSSFAALINHPPLFIFAAKTMERWKETDHRKNSALPREVVWSSPRPLLKYDYDQLRKKHM